MKSDYSQINIENFFNMSGELPFNVFVRLGEGKFTKIFKKGDKVDRERFISYQEKGVKELFIHKTERREYIGATERLLRKLASQDNISPEEARQAVEELTEQTIFEIYEDKIFDEHSVRRAGQVVQSYVDNMKKDVRSLAFFISLSRNETYMCRHSIATAVFALLLAKADTNMNEKLLNIIGMGGLLHDIGMSQLPEGIDDIDRKLTDEEWDQIKQHPLGSAQMARQVKSFPTEVITVLLQHHENWDGSGYPRGLKREEIFYPARVVAIADSFSALTTRRGGRSLYTPQDAVALMQSEEGKYDPKLLSKFAELLGAVKKQAA
ncbi:MAG: HD domain-containing protein [Bdellovibrionales bacterium]|nr:HD domain-containing protein [Bdellovibrionales bacterium]